MAAGEIALARALGSTRQKTGLHTSRHLLPTVAGSLQGDHYIWRWQISLENCRRPLANMMEVAALAQAPRPAAPHQVAAFKARLAAASRPGPASEGPLGRAAAGALAARPAAARQLSTIESAGSDSLNATGPRQMARHVLLVEQENPSPSRADVLDGVPSAGRRDGGEA